jgi:hypothetical protein
MSLIAVVTRKQAVATGEKFYNTGLKCQRGHFSPRYVRGGVCVTCRQSILLARRMGPPRPRVSTVDWTRLTEPQIEAWYLGVDQIRQRASPKLTHKPLIEKAIIYMPKMIELA